MIPLTAYAAAPRAAELARQRLDATHFLPDRPAKRRLRMPRLVIALVIAMGAVGPLTPLAHAGPAGPIVPSAIQVPDGSKVVGRRLEGVTVDPTAIPWLLLSAASTSAGPDGARLADTTYVQRVNSVGGLTPPAAGCDTNTVTTVEEVPYTADYYFWKAKP